MTANAMHWPGAVGMFLDSKTPYFVGTTFKDEERVGKWSGFAKSEAEARLTMEAIFKRAVSNGVPPDAINRLTVRQATQGETAAIITGAEYD